MVILAIVGGIILGGTLVFWLLVRALMLAFMKGRGW